MSNLTKLWDAGSSQDLPADDITLAIRSWTDTQIEIGGFQGSFGFTNYSLSPGDKIRISVWNAQTGHGPVVFNLVVARQ